MNVIGIPRQLGPAPVRCLLVDTPAAFAAALGALAEGCPIAAVDLSLGAFRSHALASGIADQLGVLLPTHVPPMPTRNPAGGPPSPADFASVNIDQEALGDRTELTAHDHALRCLAGLSRPHLLVVVPPLPGAQWDSDNLAFLRFLAWGVAPTSSRLWVVGDRGSQATLSEASTHVAWTACDAPRVAAGRRIVCCTRAIDACWPAVAPPHLSDQLAGQAPNAVELPSGYCVVCPQARPRPGAIEPRAVSALRPLLMEAGLSAFACLHGFRYDLEPRALAGQAIRHFGEGGLDLSLRLMRRACELERAGRARLRGHTFLGRMYLLRRMFAEAAALPEPSPHGSADDRATLFEQKGWGLVMTGEPARALAAFARADDLLEGPEGRRERLYLRNIWALAYERAGQSEVALACEQRIRAHLERQPPALRDIPFAYVNAINRARLHRKLQQWPEAQAAYHEAFQTTDGLRSESDLLYQRLCLSRLCSERDRASEAFVHMLAAALSWCASRVPEAVGPRAVASLVARCPDPAQRGAGRVTAGLRQALAQTAQRAQLVPRAARPMAVVPIGDVPLADRVALRPSGAAGLALWVSSKSMAESVQDPERAALCREAAAWLGSWAGDQALAGAAALVLDDCGGCGAPAAARRLIARQAFWRYCLNGSPADSPAIGLSPGVRELDRALGRVIFRRYRAPVVLGEPALACASAACAGPIPLASLVEQLSADLSAKHVARLLASLVEARVLAIEPPASKCPGGARRRHTKRETRESRQV